MPRRLWAIGAAVACASLALAGIAAASANPNLKSLTLWDGQAVVVYCPNGTLSDNAVLSHRRQVNCLKPTTTTTTTQPTTSTSSTTTTTVPSGGKTVASLIPASIFNQQVTSWPTDPNSASLVASVNSQWQKYYNNFGVSNADPIYVVPSGTPLSSVSCSGCNTDPQVPVPAYTPSSGSDLPLFLVNPSTNKLDEFWLFKPSGSGYTASWGGQAALGTFSGIFPNPYGESATGISYSATAVTASDLQSGAIDHAIAMTLVNCNGGIYPADRTDCGSSPGSPAEGQWFRFAASVNCASYTSTPFEHMVCLAGQRYGFVVTDKSGAIEISAQEGSGVTAYWDGQQEYQVIAGLPWSQLQAIDPPQGSRYGAAPVPYRPWALLPYSKHQVPVR